MNASEIKVRRLQRRLGDEVRKNNRKIEKIMIDKDRRIREELNEDALYSDSLTASALNDAVLEYQARAFIIRCIEQDLAECEAIALREKENLLRVKLAEARQA